MSTLGVANAIRDTIDFHVNARQSLLQTANKGANALTLENYTPYIPGETIAVRDKNKTEIHRVACTENDQLILCQPLTATYATTDEAHVRKLYGSQVVEQVIIGNPETLSNYPAITVEVRDVEREPFTLESVSDTYYSEITVWNDATNFTDCYANLLALTDAVEVALFRELFPLVQPYVLTYLTEPTVPTDTVIRVESVSGIQGVIVLENASGTRRINYVRQRDSTTNVITLAKPVASAFKVGDRVIHLLTSAYDPRVESVRFADATDKSNNSLLKSASITFSLKIHRLRDKRCVR